MRRLKPSQRGLKFVLKTALTADIATACALPIYPPPTMPIPISLISTYPSGKLLQPSKNLLAQSLITSFLHVHSKF